MNPKRLILLLDGTWNDKEFSNSDTNIVRIQQALVKSLGGEETRRKAKPVSNETTKLVQSFVSGEDRENFVFYQRGIGTGGLDRYSGGIFGDGLDRNIRNAYKFISYWYEPGDQIFVFGFSRGAFTARSLIGFIAASGLLRRETCTAENESIAWGYYRTPPDQRLPGIYVQLQPHVHERERLQIDCVAVFDTVGALGIPFQRFDRINRDKYSFHNVDLSSITKVNLQALAIDEHRTAFEATIWRKPQFKRYTSKTEQVWFPGSHSDVGGGLIPDHEREADNVLGLDDIALDWLLKRVTHHFPDVPFRRTAWRATDSQWAGAVQHEGREGPYRLEPLAYRCIANHRTQNLAFREGAVCYDRHAETIGEMIHISALERLGAPIAIGGKATVYRPKNLLCVLGLVRETYGGSGRRAPGGVHVVDWSGHTLSPANEKHRKRVNELIDRCLPSPDGIDSHSRQTSPPPLGRASEKTESTTA